MPCGMRNHSLAGFGTLERPVGKRVDIFGLLGRGGGGARRMLDELLVCHSSIDIRAGQLNYTPVFADLTLWSTFPQPRILYIGADTTILVQHPLNLPTSWGLSINTIPGIQHQ